MNRPTSPTVFERAIVWLGAIALVLLGLLICASVGLRLVGTVIKGSSEIGEMLIVIVAATAIVTATITDGHPYVHMLVDKLKSNVRYKLAACVSFVAALFWVVLAWVNGAVTIENARLIEETELLRISVIPFRWLWVACLIAVAAVLVHRAVRALSSGSEQPKP